jgi:hypothetical protein
MAVTSSRAILLRASAIARRQSKNFTNGTTVKLFALKADPDEMVNLAIDKTLNRDLIVTMNNKLEALIKMESGVGNAREVPNIPLINWTDGRVDLQAKRFLALSETHSATGF